MNKISIYLLILTAGLSFASCDIIEGSYLENNDFVDTATNEVVKKNALILEFTGHTCKSCPKAHRTIDQLEEIYGHRVVSVAFHTGYFARTFSGDKFNTDFRTDQGSEMEAYFEFAVFPIGLVGSLDKARQTSYSSWPAEASATIEEEAPVKLLTELEYVESSGEVEVKVGLINKKYLEGEIKLAVYLVESGIISWQKDEDRDPIDVEDYEHNHVFRTSAGSVWGEALSQSDCSANANTQIIKQIQLNPDWVPENCTIVAFLYDAVSRDVLQCTSEALIK